MNATTPAATLEAIELKLAYLERANQELSDVVYAQQQELDALKTRLTLLAERMQDASPADSPWTQEEERPPHY